MILISKIQRDIFINIY